jgi:hypothetical protein
MVVYAADLERSPVGLDGLASEGSSSNSRVDKVEASSQAGEPSSSPSRADTYREADKLLGLLISFMMGRILSRLGI